MHKIEYSGQGIMDGKVQLPSSKSISNRLLILNYLCGQSLQIDNLSAARDTKILAEILTSSNIAPVIDCKDAGTVFRFMLALCAIQEGQSFKLCGTKRLLERPHDILIKALRELGADIEWAASKEYLIIQGKQLRSKALKLPGDISSQFISALCLIAPKVKGGLSLEIEAPILSKPYISMTLDIMQDIGLAHSWNNQSIRIEEQHFPRKSQNIIVENDWSSACFFYALAILSKKASIKIDNLPLKSLQGDAQMAVFAQGFGIQSIEKGNHLHLIKKEAAKASEAKHFELGNYPDLSIPFITACAIMHPKTTFSGLEHLRHKESDRINSLKIELEKVGIFLKEQNGHISISQQTPLDLDKSVIMSSHDDHRIAMSLSLLSLHFKEVLLDNIDCVSKSFPTYFEQIAPLGFR